MSRKSEENRIIDLQKSRERLLEMINSDSAAFTMYVCEYRDQEYFDVKVEYEICGVFYEKKRGKLKLIINLNRMEPVEVRLDPWRLKDLMAADIAENCPFLLKGSYHLYFDRDSVREINRAAKLKEFKQDLDYHVRDRGLSMEEALPVIYEFVRETLPETSYQSVEELESAAAGKQPKADRMVLEMTPPGAPCPHCNGQLSERALKELLMKIYLRYRRGDDSYDC